MRGKRVELQKAGVKKLGQQEDHNSYGRGGRAARGARGASRGARGGRAYLDFIQMVSCSDLYRHYVAPWHVLIQCFRARGEVQEIRRKRAQPYPQDQGSYIGIGGIIAIAHCLGWKYYGEWDELTASGAPSDDYIPSFPRNPFHKNGKPIRGITCHLGGNHNLPLLSPYGFTRLIHSIAGGELSVQDARSILRPILRVFQLRRVIASQVQLSGKQVVRVGAHMPRYTITTIELAMTALQAQAYYKVHEAYLRERDVVAHAASLTFLFRLSLLEHAIYESRIAPHELNHYWPADFYGDMDQPYEMDQPFSRAGQVYQKRVPLGFASKIYVNDGEKDMNGHVVAEGDEGWYYRWWCGIYCLMGDEGYIAGLHMVRGFWTTPVMTYGSRPSFKVGAKAVIQSSGFEESAVNYRTDNWDVASPELERLRAEAVAHHPNSCWESELCGE
ncbi:hypothetical protein JMJ35_004165 [Cladonia borealis]|uniref:Uncharacterized protein n=1 Tax=Cladonia borealis TaxID=184061 RepID=A0AA39V5X5_9LECA|nr:hypothetical protein JMJ35_004165 [Cladonia borealis]